MSFPPGTEMFQFPGFASRTYGFSPGSSFRKGLPRPRALRPPGAERGFSVAHPPRAGGGDRDRPDALVLAKHALPHLSYTPPPRAPRELGRPARQSIGVASLRLVGQGGLEPPTSR